MFNGEKKVLYYADALTEIAFVVPSLSESSGQYSLLLCVLALKHVGIKKQNLKKRQPTQ